MKKIDYASMNLAIIIKSNQGCSQGNKGVKISSICFGFLIIKKFRPRKKKNQKPP